MKYVTSKMGLTIPVDFEEDMRLVTLPYNGMVVKTNCSENRRLIDLEYIDYPLGRKNQFWVDHSPHDNVIFNIGGRHNQDGGFVRECHDLHPEIYWHLNRRDCLYWLRVVNPLCGAIKDLPFNKTASELIRGGQVYGEALVLIL